MMKFHLNFTNSVLIFLSTIGMSACVVAPPQPIGYRQTSSVLPTYVNGQYVGMQPSNYGAPSASNPPSNASSNAASSVALNGAPNGASNVAAPVGSNVNNNVGNNSNTPQVQTPAAPAYIQSTTPSVVYIQAPPPVYRPYYGPTIYPYSYSYPYPYYSPFYPSPWFGGIGIGLNFGWGGYYGHRHH